MTTVVTVTATAATGTNVDATLTLSPLQPESVTFTYPAVTPVQYVDGEYTFTAPIEIEQTITASVLPAGTSQALTWAIVSGTASFKDGIDTGVTVTVVLPGTDDEVVVTATSSGATPKTAKLTIDVVSSDILVGAFHVEGEGTVELLEGNAPATELYSVVFTAPSSPTDETVKWFVFLFDDFGAAENASAFATIDQDSGVLTAIAAGTVYVFAQAQDAGNAVTAGFAVVIEEYEEPPTGPQLFRAAIGNQAAAGDNHTVVTGIGDAATLTMRGTGAIGGAAHVFNYVYFDAGNVPEFTAMVKVDAATFGSINDNSRIGIKAVAKSSVNNDSSTGVITTTHATAALTAPLGMVYMGSHARPNNASVIGFSAFRAVPTSAGTGGGGTGWNAATERTRPATDAALDNAVWMRLQRFAHTTAGQYRWRACISTPHAVTGLPTTWDSRPETNDDAAVLAHGMLIGLIVSSNADVSTATFSDLHFKAGAGMGATTVTIDQLDRIPFANIIGASAP
jgi:hypothetical protein